MLNRGEVKLEAKGILRSAEVSAVRFILFYFLISLILSLISSFFSGSLTYEDLFSALNSRQYAALLHRLAPFGAAGYFASVLVWLINMLLTAGVTIYCLGIRRRERMEYTDLFAGFSFAFRVIALTLLMALFIWLWTLLFIIPGLIAIYRYRYALYNLCENPDLGPLEAIRLSKAQTQMFKGDLFVFDLSFLGWLLLCSVPTGLYGWLCGALSFSPAPFLDTILTQLLSLPYVFLTFYRTVSDLGYRERILVWKEKENGNGGEV